MEHKIDDIFIQRLEKLKQVVILNYLDTIDFDKTKDFYDLIMKSLFQGDFDYIFLSKNLVGIDIEERTEIFQLARKYKSLCFYLGDFNHWADSIGGEYLADLDLVGMKLLDNYDFLLGLAKDGGEDLLKQLLAFQDSPMAREGSVIDFLRNCFENDSLLKEILFEFTNENGLFQAFSDEQKRILCTYPEGVLYTVEEGEIQVVSREKLIENLQRESILMGMGDSSVSDFDFSMNAEPFENIVLNVMTNYQNTRLS